MPRTLKSDKFFIYAPKKSGYFKGKILMGVNPAYKGGPITLDDLIAFLKEKSIDPTRIELSSGFTLIAKV